MPSQIQAMLRQGQTQDKMARDLLRDNQRLSGVLCDIQGLNTGVSKNNNGNQVYVAIGGGVDSNGNVANTQVINAWLSNPNGTWQPGEPVIVEYNREQKRWFVTGIDPVAVASSGGSVQYYNQMSPSRMYIDSGFILDFLCRPVISSSPSTLVEVKPGVLYTNGNRYEFNGAYVNLSPYVTSVDTHAIAQLWYNPTGNNIQVTTSTEQSTSTAFDDTDWAETITSDTDGWLVLQSYTVNESSDTLIDQSNLLRDNRPIYTLPSNPVNVLDRIMTDLNGEIMVDANGNVMIAGA